MPTSTASTTTHDIGSNPLTPYWSDAITRASAIEAAIPRATPMRRDLRAVAIDEAANLLRRGAERRTDAELAAAPADRVAEHAEEAAGGRQHGDPGERRPECRGRARTRQFLAGTASLSMRIW